MVPHPTPISITFFFITAPLDVGVCIPYGIMLCSSGVTNDQVVVEDKLIRERFWISTHWLAGVEGGNRLGIFYVSYPNRLFWMTSLGDYDRCQKVELVGIRTSNLT